MTSSRLPGKVLKPVLGRVMLDYMIERLRRAPCLDDVVIATTTNSTDQPIVEFAEQHGVNVFRGSEQDVMGRVLNAARAYQVDVIVETTGDCPLVDWRIVSRVVDEYRNSDYDYVANNTVISYPDGMDVRVFSTATLADAEARTNDAYDREHVTPYIFNNKQRYTCLNLKAPPAYNYPAVRLTLDTPQDLTLISNAFEALYPGNPDFSLDDLLYWLDGQPEVTAAK